jgi:menaquinone-9 beta-reductase
MLSETLLEPRYDALIVGARAAGAATALLLARAGLRVLAVDRAPLGSDTISTHTLVRGAVLQLHRWGVLRAVQQARTPPIRATTFHYGDEAVTVPVKERHGIDALYAPRRTVLDPLLVRAASESGARVVHGITVVDLLRDPARGRVTGAVLARPDGSRGPVEASIVIGADGLRSAVARYAGARVERAGRHATAIVYGHFAGLPSEGQHLYFRKGVAAGEIPTNDGRTCVFVGVPPERLRREMDGGVDALFRRALAQADAGLARAVEDAQLDAKLRPFPATPGFFRRAWGPGWALVGDAGYFKDPLTAHGITDALRDAELLARAVVSGTDSALAAYQATRDAVSLPLFEVTDRMASLAWELEEVKRDHQLLSREMAAETELVAGFGREPIDRVGASRDARSMALSA